MRKNIFSIIIFLPFISYAQVKNNSAIGLANQEFSNYRYAYAIPFYKTHLKQHPTDTVALVRIAYCYKISNQYDSALHYYKQADSLGGLHDNSLAELYANEGDYNNAVKVYGRLLQLNLSAEDKKMYTQRMEGFKHEASFKKDTLNYQVYYLKINTPANEMNAVPYKNGLVFESDRAHKINGVNEFGWDGNAYSKLYYKSDTENLRLDTTIMGIWHDKKTRKAISDYTRNSINDNSNFTHRFNYAKVPYTYIEVPLFSKALDTKVNYGAIAFSNDGKICFYTKSEKAAKGVSQLAIWQASKDSNGNWSNVVKLPFNKKAYSYFHPAISADGNRLYFISDQPGGYGGTDIYYVEKQGDGNWSSDPVNAGNKINTSGNELFPTCYEGILYFSSNGHAGLGGLDIYKYEGQDLNSGKVTNLGYPVNTNKDEFGFSRNQNRGYFSSNRYGSDDIFEYEYAIANIILKGKIDLSGLNPNEKVIAKLYAKEDTTKLLSSVTVDNNGAYEFKVQPEQAYVIGFRKADENSRSNYDIVADNYKKVKRGYEKEIPQLKARDLFPAPSVVAKPEVEEKKNEIAALNKIDSTGKYIVYYAFDKYNIAKRYTKTLDSVVNYMQHHAGYKVVIGSFTDCAGTNHYNEKLSARRSAAVIAYLIKKGIKRNRMIEGHYGKAYLVKACKESEFNKTEQWENRRTEILISINSIKNWKDLH